MRAQRFRQLDRHVPEPAEADDGHLAVLADVPMAQGRPCGDPRAEKRRRGLEVQPVGDFHDEFFLHDDPVGIAAIGRRPFPVEGVVSVGRPAAAVLLQTVFAGVAFEAGVDHAADADVIALAEARHIQPHGDNAPDDFVSRDHGIDRVAPVVARLMQIGMADAAVEDLDRHIVGARIAAFELKRNQWRGRRMRRIAVGFHCHQRFSDQRPRGMARARIVAGLPRY